MSSDRDIHLPMEGNGAQEYGFLRPAWYGMLARHCFAGAAVHMARAQTGNSRVILPLVDQDDRISSLSNYYSFAYGPMFEGTPTMRERQAMLIRIAADLKKSRHRVSLYPLIEDGSGMADELRRAFAKAGWIAVLTDQNSNHVLNLRGRDFATYWEQRPGQLRSSVKRKSKAERYHFEIKDHISDASWTNYCAIYASSWKNAEPWPEMIRAMAQEAAVRGALRLGFAYRKDDGRPVATQLWTKEGDTACIHKIAHDSSEDASSPGTLLSHHMFAHMIDAEKIAHIDYGTGGNSYKRDWMEHERPMLRLDCFDPRRASLWLPALKTRISRLVRRPS